MEEQILNIMKNLQCSREDALDVLESDRAIDKGEETYFDLDEEAEKEAKKYTATGTRKSAEKVERKRKENPTKATIIEEITALLTEKEYENVEITNKERQIRFNVGENTYEITLTQKRKPKN